MTCQPITCCSPRIAKHIKLEYQLKPWQVFNVETHLDTSIKTHAGCIDHPKQEQLKGRLNAEWHTTVQSLQAIPTNMCDYHSEAENWQIHSFGSMLWHQEMEVEKSPKGKVGHVDASGCFSIRGGAHFG